jgi:tetratricopeptide (TPR) repeat protein
MDALKSLREAVQHSPHNLPLRRHLAEVLLEHGLAADAEQEYRDALALSPDDAELKLGLARAFFQQGKASHALVIVEDLTKSPDASARAHVLHAKLLAGTGDVEQAVRHYRRGIEKDAAAADPEFSARLGLDADDENGDVVDGKVRAAWDDDPSPPGVEVERPTIRFDDVGGMESVKEEIRLKINPSTRTSGTVRGVREGGRRRHPAVRSSRLREDAPRARHRGRDRGGLHRGGH